MADIFINYRSSDEDYGAILIDRFLVAHFGDDRIFRDSRSMPAGTDFPSFLWQRLRESRVLIVVIGPRWLTRDEHGRRRIDDPNDFVRREIAYALDHGIPVVPVLLDDTTLPAAAVLPHDIRGLVDWQYRTVRKRTAEHDMQRILAELEQWVPRKQRPAGDAPPAPTVIAPQIGTINGPVAFGPNSSAVSYGNDTSPRTGS